MPGISGGARRKTFRGKRSVVRRKKTVRQIATSAAKQVINRSAEKKYLDLTATNPASVSGGIFQLNDIPVGTSDTTRIGDTIMIKKLYMSLNMHVADTSNHFRVIVFVWKNNTVPLASEIMADSSLGTAYAVNAPYNHDRRSLFKVLYDKTYGLYADRPVVHFKKSIKLNLKVQYNAGSSTACSNAIWMLYISDSGAVAHPTADSYTRLEYTDI